MKRIAVEAVVVSIFIYAIVQIGTGCAALGKVGDGKLDVDAGAVIEAAAAGASGDYAKALAKIYSAVQKKKEASIELDAAMKAAGFAFSRAMYFDGALIEDEKRFSKREWWEKVTIGDASVSNSKKDDEPATAEDDALAGEIADIITSMGLAE